jgi:hypothetical protein
MSMDNETTIRAVITADHERIRAVLARDRVALDLILCDELVYTHSSGSEEDKATYIERVVSGAYDYRSFQQIRRVFRIAQEFVFMHGDNEVDIVRNGELQLLAGRYMMVWRREGEDWRLFSFTAAPVARS